MKFKHLTRPFEVKAVRDDGTFDGYGSVFNVIDSYRDIVIPGAFAKTIAKHAEQKSAPALLWQHNTHEPVGVWDSMSEDEHGLKMVGRLALGTQRGKEAYELLKMGAVRGLSIGFSVPKGGAEYNDTTDLMMLKEIDLWETSIVTFPANPSAQVTEVRSVLEQGIFPDLRSFEEFLMHDAGFSRSQARVILNEGYKALLKQDADDVKAEVLTVLKSINR